MTLKDIIHHAKQHIDSGDSKPIFIMVAGGSATGKSTRIVPHLLEKLGKDNVLVVEQDWYQLGRAFKEKDSSPYRWDDPRNFQIERLAKDLKSLSDGHLVVAPSFDVVKVDSLGARKLLPQPIIIVDGIYSLYGELATIADYKIYAAAPLYARFLGRLFRTLYDLEQDMPQTPFRQVFGTVLLAHQEIVASQAQHADCIEHVPYLFADSISRYGLEAKSISVPHDSILYFEHDGIQFQGHADKRGKYHFYISYQGRLYYEFEIEDKNRTLLEGPDYLAS
jgi:uridine kinase